MKHRWHTAHRAVPLDPRLGSPRLALAEPPFSLLLDSDANLHDSVISHALSLIENVIEGEIFVRNPWKELNDKLR
jgi:hypothetical protein